MEECHHVPAAAFTHVMNQIQARHWLGLTATPYRPDKLHSLIYHQVGQISHTISPAVPQQLPTQAHEIAEPTLTLEPAPDQACRQHASQADSEAPQESRLPGRFWALRPIRRGTRRARSSRR
ncbi:DEAD/DEAH box helicase family protein [Arthrobacter sp. 754]|uniref:DEAD/DEAH box helicase family protein n=1 Tax=Arthrobacter sp. 754 TaxID=3156315 RepID=UPI0033957D18